MQRRPAMADQLSEVLADRQMRNMRILSEQSGEGALDSQVSLAQQFLGGIQSFFGLHRNGSMMSRGTHRASSGD